MLSKATILALAAASAVQAATPQGFNYGSTLNNQARTQQDFENDFKGAQALTGAPGTFNSARLYTMIDGVDPSKPISALAAAQNTQTYLLLGLWASGASSGFDNEIAALKSAVSQYPDLAQYILGISVGSEDLYRISPTGLAAADAAPGNGPDVIVDYIKRARAAIQGTSWSNIKVGHVDTWTAWVNGSNSAVIDNSDFLGVDAYPYFQNTQANAIGNGKSLFNQALDNTKGVASGKEVWITETGWPIYGKTSGQAEVGTSFAQQYWDDVGCPNFGNTPTFWYTLDDGVQNGGQNGSATTPSFSIADRNNAFKPYFDLSCSNVSTNSTSNSTSNLVANSTSSSSKSSTSGTVTGTASVSTGTGSASGSGASNGTYTGTPSQPSGSSSGSGSSGSGSASGSSGSGSSSASASGSKSSSTGIATSSASSLTMSLGSMAAVAAAVVALL